MNLIIEAGGSKSNLAFVENGEIISAFNEPGIQLSQERIEDFEKRVIQWSELQPQPIQSIFLFAAGKIDPSKEKKLVEILKNTLHANEIEIHSDLLAACYATAGNNAGIVGILGTGSNSCYYNGTYIEKNVSPGGFILGDEGSGSHLGKRLLIDYLRLNMPLDVQQILENEFNLSGEFVIQNIYGGNVRSAGSFCSSFAPFIVSRLHHPYCEQLCRSSIQQYLHILENNYLHYSNKLYLVGSVAFHLKELIHDEATKKNIEIIKITQHPIKDLSLFLSGR